MKKLLITEEQYKRIFLRDKKMRYDVYEPQLTLNNIATEILEEDSSSSGNFLDSVSDVLGDTVQTDIDLWNLYGDEKIESHEEESPQDQISNCDECKKSKHLFSEAMIAINTIKETFKWSYPDGQAFIVNEDTNDEQLEELRETGINRAIDPSFIIDRLSLIKSLTAEGDYMDPLSYYYQKVRAIQAEKDLKEKKTKEAAAEFKNTHGGISKEDWDANIEGGEEYKNTYYKYYMPDLTHKTDKTRVDKLDKLKTQEKILDLDAMMKDRKKKEDEKFEKDHSKLEIQERDLGRVLDDFNEWNLRIIKQSQLKSHVTEACKKKIDIPMSMADGVSMRTTIQDNLLKECKNQGYGGVWLYGHKKINKSMQCGCVDRSAHDLTGELAKIRNRGTEVKFLGSNGYVNDSPLKNAPGILTLPYDYKSIGEKIGDWGKDCLGDWHCIFDVLSIIAPAFGPIGWGVAAGLDIISAAGYAYEGKDGWVLNAGLTLIGALGSGLDFAKYSKGINATGIKSLKYIGKNADKIKDIKSWNKVVLDATKDASLKDKKIIYDLLNDVAEATGKIGEDKVLKSLGQLGKLSKHDQKIYRMMVKEGKLAKYLELTKLDLNKAIKEYMTSKSFREVAIQGSVFAAMNIYGKEIAEGILAFQKHTGIPIAKWMALTKDEDPTDPASKEYWDEMVEKLGNYGTTIEAIIKLDATITSQMHKYGLNPSDFGDVLINLIINKNNPLVGVELMASREYMQKVADYVVKLEEQNKSEKDIKAYLKEEYGEMLLEIKNKLDKEEGKKLKELIMDERRKNSFDGQADYGNMTDEEFKKMLDNNF